MRRCPEFRAAPWARARSGHAAQPLDLGPQRQNNVQRLSHPCSGRFSRRQPRNGPHIVRTSSSLPQRLRRRSCSPLVFLSTRAALSTEHDHRVRAPTPWPNIIYIYIIYINRETGRPHPKSSLIPSRKRASMASMQDSARASSAFPSPTCQSLVGFPIPSHPPDVPQCILLLLRTRTDGHSQAKPSQGTQHV